jgi:hypothetical protein
MKTPTSIKTPGFPLGSGSYGSYYIYDSKKNLGVKTVGRSYTRDEWENYFIDSLDAIVKDEDRRISWTMDSSIFDVIAEYAYLKMLDPIENIPKGYGLTWVEEENGSYSLGILMEHIDGKTAYEAMDCDGDNGNKQENLDMEDYFDFQNKMYEQTKPLGIKIEDWHDENVLVDREGNLYRIDFSHGHVGLTMNARIKMEQIAMNEFVSLMETFPETA